MALALSPIELIEPEMHHLLGEALRRPSVSGSEGEFTRWLADSARSMKFDVDLWQSVESDFTPYGLNFPAHLPLDGRPTAVIRMPGTGGGRSLILNAHTDVVGVADPAAWSRDPWGGCCVDGRFIGRGACDVKGALVSALWAMRALKRTGPLRGDLLLELVPGEEDCVMLGTLGSVARGYSADACIVLEPTESLPRCASRGGCRFEIECLGRSVHGTVKWLGEDAIALMQLVLSAISKLELRWNDRAADLTFSSYPIARPVTVDKVHGGTWQGMLADSCKVGGYLELLPNDDISLWQQRFLDELCRELDVSGANSRRIKVRFPERYWGNRTSTDSELCKIALATIEDSPSMPHNVVPWAGWQGFNAGCEAGLRAHVHNTPTLVWGPGGLVQAHAVDEFVEFAQVRTVAERLWSFARLWCG